MADSPSSDKDKTTGAPTPEVLKPQSEESISSADVKVDSPKANLPKRMRRGSYRPSHKATFIGLAVMVAILAINAAVIFFIMRGQNSVSAQGNREEVTLSSESLDKLGVSRNAVGDLGTELIIGPNSRFSGNVTVAGDTSIGGQLKLNSKFTASDASLAKLQAGDVSVNKLDVNGDTTTGGLNVARELAVAGTTRLQGAVTMSQMLTVNNSVNIAGNLAVGGQLSARAFQASSLVSDTTLLIGGHIITRGAATSVGRGGNLGAVDTVSISGNDTAGTVAINLASNSSRNGHLASVAFRNNFGSIPHVVITPVGGPAGNFYVTRTVGGFSIYGSVSAGLAGGSVLFDYIVMQ